MSEDFDFGPVTRGVRHRLDHRSHVDRLNGPLPCGPAVLPQIEERDLARLKEDADTTDVSQGGADEIDEKHTP